MPHTSLLNAKPGMLGALSILATTLSERNNHRVGLGAVCEGDFSGDRQDLLISNTAVPRGRIEIADERTREGEPADTPACQVRGMGRLHITVK